MNLRTNTFAFVLSCLPISVLAQQSDTLYLNSEKVQTEKTEASFIKILTYDKKGKKVENEKFFTLEGTLIEEINYRKEKREGYYYHKDLNQKTETVGEYKKDQKIGIWKTSSMSGINLYYDVFTDPDVLEGRYCEQPKTDEIFEFQPQESNDRKNPSYPGGWSAWHTYLGSNLNRPKNVNTSSSDPALMTFTVYADGTLADITLEKSSGFSEVDQEAMRVLRESGKWVPGQINEIPVSMRMKIALRIISQGR